jgi:hypothetical protein
MKKIFIYFAILSFFACASVSTAQTNKLSLGMTKAEVIELLGEPQRVSAFSGKEIMEYDVRGKAYKACAAFTGATTLGMATGICNNRTELFEITIVNGKVDGYRSYE